MSAILDYGNEPRITFESADGVRPVPEASDFHLPIVLACVLDPVSPLIRWPKRGEAVTADALGLATHRGWIAWLPDNPCRTWRDTGVVLLTEPRPEAEQ